jgi:polar amino acid transport system substrate-binding protein
MKKGLLIAVILALLSVTYAKAKETISISGEKWPPYNSYVIDSRNPGFMFEIVAKILAQNGYDFVYTEQPWARAIESTRTGKFDALIGAAKGDAPDFIFPSEPIGFTRNVIYVRHDATWQFCGLESLPQINLGVLKSMTYGEALDAYILKHQHDKQRISIISGNDYLARNFEKLGLGRIDATIDDQMVIGDFLKRTGRAEKFRMAGAVGEGYGINLAFSPRHPHAKRFAEIISRGVAALRNSNELQTILAKYGAQDWQNQAAAR